MLVHVLARGNYDGPEPERLAALKLAALKGAPYVDVEYKAAPLFFAGREGGGGKGFRQTEMEVFPFSLAAVDSHFTMFAEVEFIASKGYPGACAGEGGGAW